MAKLTSDFEGVPNGEFYPVQFKTGEECPPELEEAARILGALDAKPVRASKAKTKE